MRFVVIGAGSIGASLGGLLARAGHSVHLVARGPHLDALRADGLEWRTAFDRTRLSLPASGIDDVVPDLDDVLLIATKLPELSELIDSLAARFGDVPVVMLQNGTIGDVWAGKVFSRVVGTVVYVPANVLRPGQVTMFGTPTLGRVRVGAVTGEVSALCATLAADWTRDHLVAEVSHEIAAHKRRKTVVDLAGVPWVLFGDAGAPAGKRAQAEAEAVYAAASLPVAPLEEILAPDLALATIDGDQRPGPSLDDSLRKGRRTEVPYTFGEIVRLGASVGVATPMCRKILDLMRWIETHDQLPALDISVLSID